MREISMLFKPEMIRLIREGIKTQTRRVKFRPIAPGDRIYIKEGHYRFGVWKKNGLTKSGKQKWKFLVTRDPVRYLENPPFNVQKNTDRGAGWYKRSPLFMPKKLARIWLEVVDIKKENLHLIGEHDARAEGAIRGIFREGPNVEKKEFQLEANNHATYHDGFKFLWMTINGRESWDANPMVRAITFKKVDK